MRIRMATDDDTDEILELDRACFPGEPWASFERDVAWVVRDGSDVAAYAAARLSTTFPGEAYLSRVGVARAARGAGLQARLIRVRLAWARREGATLAYTYTAPWNAASMRSLCRAGFRPGRARFQWFDVVWWECPIVPRMASVTCDASSGLGRARAGS